MNFFETDDSRSALYAKIAEAFIAGKISYYNEQLYIRTNDEWTPATNEKVALKIGARIGHAKAVETIVKEEFALNEERDICDYGLFRPDLIFADDKTYNKKLEVVEVEENAKDYNVHYKSAKARIDAVKKFIKIFNAQTFDNAFEAIATYCVKKEYNEKAFIFTGTKGAGKNTAIKLLERLCGDTQKLHQFCTREIGYSQAKERANWTNRTVISFEETNELTQENKNYFNSIITDGYDFMRTHGTLEWQPATKQNYTLFFTTNSIPESSGSDERRYITIELLDRLSTKMSPAEIKNLNRANTADIIKAVELLELDKAIHTLEVLKLHGEIQNEDTEELEKVANNLIKMAIKADDEYFIEQSKLKQAGITKLNRREFIHKNATTKRIHNKTLNVFRINQEQEQVFAILNKDNITKLALEEERKLLQTNNYEEPATLTEEQALANMREYEEQERRAGDPDDEELKKIEQELLELREKEEQERLKQLKINNELEAKGKTTDEIFAITDDELKQLKQLEKKFKAKQDAPPF